jgi:hypothetical protein
LNFLFIGGGVVVQLLSGAAAQAMRTAGAPPSQIYAAIHLGFAVALIAVTAIYAFSHEKT